MVPALLEQQVKRHGLATVAFSHDRHHPPLLNVSKYPQTEYERLTDYMRDLILGEFEAFLELYFARLIAIDC